MKTFDLVITRHPALLTYLKEIELADETTEVETHASAEMVTGKHTCGVLPHHLSCHCKTHTEIPMNLPPELRGVELNIDQVRQYAGEPVTYRVFTESYFQNALDKVGMFAHADGCSAILDFEKCF